MVNSVNNITPEVKQRIDFGEGDTIFKDIHISKHGIGCLRWINHVTRTRDGETIKKLIFGKPVDQRGDTLDKIENLQISRWYNGNGEHYTGKPKLKKSTRKGSTNTGLFQIHFLKILNIHFF